MDTNQLMRDVEALYADPKRSHAAVNLLNTVRQGLNDGSIRVAEPDLNSTTSTPGFLAWRVNVWVKKAMLLMSSLGHAVRITRPDGSKGGVDLDTLPWRSAAPERCRMPDGSLLRDGAFVGPGSTCFPPSVLQLGSYLGEGAVVDSFVSIGAGAQIGARVQLSCRSAVGGYIVPLDQLPTIIEDEVLMGVGTGVYDGAQVGFGAVLLAGTQILPSLGIYDLGSGHMVPRADGEPLRVPPHAVVAMGSRPLGSDGMQIQIPIIVGRKHGTRIEDWEMYTDLDIVTRPKSHLPR